MLLVDASSWYTVLQLLVCYMEQSAPSMPLLVMYISAASSSVQQHVKGRDRASHGTGRGQCTTPTHICVGGVRCAHRRARCALPSAHVCAHAHTYNIYMVHAQHICVLCSGEHLYTTGIGPVLLYHADDAAVAVLLSSCC